MEDADAAMAQRMQQRALELNNVQIRVENEHLAARDAQRCVFIVYFLKK